MAINRPYTLPKLHNAKGDISKDWYVYFYYTDKLTGQKKQFRYKQGINRLKAKRRREEEASAIREALLVRLDSGWNPITEKTEKQQVDILILDAIDDVLSRKKGYLTETSYKSYFTRTRLFKEWIVENNLSHLYVQNLTPYHLRKYFDEMLEVRGVTGRTHNSHLTTLNAYFNDMSERGIILENPLKGIKAVRQDVGKISTYSESEEKRLNAHMREKDFLFFVATRFVRYAFLRRTELLNLQVKHINWKSKTITIPSSSAKSRVQDSVTIASSLEPLIKEAGYLELNPEMYLFGKKFLPSHERLTRADDLTERQRAYNIELRVKPECSFYSWKHTGAVELYNITKDPYVVMRQCRHSDIRMTMIYLRSLGCGVSEQVRSW